MQKGSTDRPDEEGESLLLRLAGGPFGPAAAGGVRPVADRGDLTAADAVVSVCLPIVAAHKLVPLSSGRCCLASALASKLPRLRGPGAARTGRGGSHCGMRSRYVACQSRRSAATFPLSGAATARPPERPSKAPGMRDAYHFGDGSRWRGGGGHWLAQVSSAVVGARDWLRVQLGLTLPAWVCSDPAVHTCGLAVRASQLKPRPCAAVLVGTASRRGLTRSRLMC